MTSQTKKLYKSLSLILSKIDSKHILSQQEFISLKLSDKQRQKYLLKIFRKIAGLVCPGTIVEVKKINFAGLARFVQGIIELNKDYLTFVEDEYPYNINQAVSIFCHELGHMTQYYFFEKDNEWDLNPLINSKKLNDRFSLEEEADTLGNLIAKRLFPKFCDHYTWFRSVSRKSVPDRQFLSNLLRENKG
jgi:hypothetical protein